MKANISQLKDQMGKIFEVLAAMKNTKDNPEVRNEEATSSNPMVS